MDRVVSMILGTSSIREVVAFPKNCRAFCPLTQVPSPVGRDQQPETDTGTGRFPTQASWKRSSIGS
jgi:aspartyl-tRNA synthetase